jgi:hypothetical protein
MKIPRSYPELKDRAGKNWRPNSDPSPYANLNCHSDLTGYNPGAMRIVVALALLFFPAVVFADQPKPIRPDPKLTPGATFDVTLKHISEPGYSKKVGNVTAEVKREVYAEYGITEHQPGEYEVDHLICAFDRRLQFNQESLAGILSHGLECTSQRSFGGPVTRVGNHWQVRPQDRTARDHDRLDRRIQTIHRPLPRLRPSPCLCQSGGERIGTARFAQRSRSCSRILRNQSLGKHELEENIFGRASNGNGKTKRGEYMTEAEAIRKGYRAAKGG